MRIGLDMHKVDDKFQGMRTHIIEIFSRAARMCPEFEFVALLDNIDKFKSEYPEFASTNVQFEYLPYSGPVRRLLWELPSMQKRLNLDLLHMQYILPFPSRCPTFVTIHDVLFESHPEFFTPFFTLRSKLLMKIAAKSSDEVFTVSHFSKKEICSRYGIDSGKVSITPNAADVRRFYPGLDGSEYLAKRGLFSKKYILSVGRLEPRKNHLALISAYELLDFDAPPLVIVGQRDFRFDAVLEKIEKSPMKEKIFVLENVADKELPALYRHCMFFAYPSLAEGFGMPPLEAMASGVPVITADNTGLTEVVDSAGILVDALDQKALGNAMKRLIGDPSLRAEMSLKGLARAKEYSWEYSAKVLSNCYIRFQEKRNLN